MRCSIAIPWYNDLPAVLAKVFAARSRAKAPLEVTEAEDEPNWMVENCSQKRESGGRPDILVPIDFSPGSLSAAKYAINVARRSRSRLILLNVIHLNLTPYGPANPAWLRAALCQEALEKMEPIMARAQGTGVPVISVIEEGAPAKVISQVAKRWRTGLIILATQKRGKLARFFHQRIKEKVLRHAECPIAIIQVNARKDKPA